MFDPLFSAKWMPDASQSLDAGWNNSWRRGQLVAKGI